MTKFPAPNPPYVGPPKYHGDANNKPIRRIVLHSTVGPTKAGSARKIAKYFQDPAVPSSCHYIVDAAESLQLTYDSVVAYHDGVNVHELGIEMCDYPVTASKGGLKRWEDADHRALLKNTIHLTVDLLLAYSLPPNWLDVPELLKGRRGITTHNNISHAFHKSTHWDPGAFPVVEFMKRVEARYNKLRR